MPEPQIGEDVTALMPAVGDDVTALMASHTPTPSPSDEERTWTDTAVDALPMIGGAVGGLLGTAGGLAGAVGLAALGGAGGEAWRQNINRLRGKSAPSSATEAAKDIAIEGGMQGATEVAGGLIGKGLQRGGKAIYRGLLKPSKAVRDGFGGDAVVKTLIDEGATISGKGLDKITGKLSASRAQALKMVEDAGPTSTMVDPKEIIAEFAPVVKTLKRRIAAGQPSELAEVGAQGKRLIKAIKTGAGMDARGAQAAKEAAQDAASGAYKAMSRGAKEQLGAQDLLNEATARGFKKAVEQRVPGVGAQNANTQRLLGATRALEDATERGSNNLAIGGARDLIAAGVGGSVAGPPGVAAGVLTRLASSPRAGSALAIGLDRVGKKVPMDDLIRALEVLISEQQQ